jgi:hypothetical protein
LKWGRLIYAGGICCLAAAFAWWLVELFLFFAEFYKYNGIELILQPLIKLFINPLFWLGILLIKLAQRVLGEADKTNQSPDQNSRPE